MSDLIFYFELTKDFITQPEILVWIKRIILFNTLGGFTSIFLYSILLLKFIRKIHPNDYKTRFARVYKKNLKSLVYFYFFGWLSIFYIIKEYKGWEHDFTALVVKRRQKNSKGYNKGKNKSRRR